MNISVIIPAYNCENWIVRAIETVLTQTRPADEVIVVDDGSTDGTAEAVRSFSDDVTLIQQENAGVSAARNTGIHAARGEWIAFLDADDEWKPDYLKRQTELLEQNPELVWSTTNFYFCNCDEDKQVEKLPLSRGKELLGDKDYFEDYCRAYVERACGWTGTMLINKKVLIEAGLFESGLSMGEDQDMWFRIAFLYPKIGYISKPLAVYHMNISGSATQKFSEPEYVINLLNRQLQHARECNCLTRFEPCARHMLYFYLHKYLHDKRIKSIRSIINQFDYLLPAGYINRMKILTLWPQLTLWCLPILKKINKYVRLKV